MATDSKKFDGLNEERLLKFKERILWHQNNGGFSNDLKPLADHVNFKYLPQPIVKFYKIIGFGEIGSPSDYLIYDITKPSFIADDDEGTFFVYAPDEPNTEQIYTLEYDFKGEVKVKDIIFLGRSVDGENMGIVKNSNKDIVTTIWGNGGTDMLSYIEEIFLNFEKYEGIKCPL